MAISDPILDPLTIVIDVDQEIPAPIQIIATGEVFPRVKITATGIYVGSGLVAPTRIATLADKRTAYTQTYSTGNKTVANPTATTPAATAVNPDALTSAALTDNSGGTANATVQAMPDPTDTPVTADNLRDDLVAVLIPAIRNNFADVVAQINALRVDLISVRAQEVALVTDRTATNAEVVKLVADDLDNRQTVTSVVDDLQALNFVG